MRLAIPLPATATTAVRIPPVADLPTSTIAIGGDVRGDVANGPIIKDSTNVTLNTITGTIINTAPRPAIERLPLLPRPPRALRSFLDRVEPLDAAQAELRAQGGAWLAGPAGCGISTFLRQAANLPLDPSLDAGVLYLEGRKLTPSLDDLLQRLFQSFYTSAQDVVVAPPSARVALASLRALFVFDDLPLAVGELSDLLDVLRESAVLIGSESVPLATLPELALAGLPRHDALRLLAQEAQVDLSGADAAGQLARLCAGLADRPVALRLVGRLLRARAYQPAEAATALAALLPPEPARAVGEPLGPLAPRPDALALAARLVLPKLSDEQQSTLAALLRVGGADADLAALTATSQLPRAAVEASLVRLVNLGLALVNAGRYEFPGRSMARVLDAELPAGDERRRAAAFFAASAGLRVGDLPWLKAEAQNILAAIKTLLADGCASEAGALAKILQPVLVLGGQWGSWGQLLTLAEAAATSSNDPALHAWALHERGTRAGLYGDLPGALADLGSARKLRLEQGDAAGADASLHNMEQLGLLPPGGWPRQREPDTQALPKLLRPTRGWFPWLFGAMLVVLLGGFGGWLLARPRLDPSFAVTPASGSYPLTVQFRAANQPGVTYQWDFGDGTPGGESAPQPGHTYSRPGSYRATLTLRDARGNQSEVFAQTITVGNTAPLVRIDQPAAGQVRAGQELLLRGSASDAEDGALPDAALRWAVLLRQGSGQRQVGEARGSVARLRLPDLADAAFAADAQIEVRLAASDSQGMAGAASITLPAETVRLRFTSQPSGLKLAVAGREITTPAELTLWAGARLALAADEQTNAAGQRLVFAGWSDAGAAHHTIVAGPETREYSARFQPLSVAFAPLPGVREADGVAEVTVMLAAASGEPQRFSYTTADDTARAGSDYEPAAGTLLFAPGETRASFSIALLDNQLDQDDRALTLQLGGPAGVGQGVLAQASLPIVDDDDPPVATLASQPVSEGAGQAQVQITLDRPSGRTVSLSYSTADGTALAGEDYQPVSDQIIFAPGITSASFSVPIVNDSRNEPEEALRLQLTNVTHAQVGAAQASLTIRDDDRAPPQVFFETAELTPPNDVKEVVLVVLLSEPASAAVSVDYTVSLVSTALPGGSRIFEQGTLTFQPNEQRREVRLPYAVGRGIYQVQPLTWRAQLSNPVGATLGEPASMQVRFQPPTPPEVSFGAAAYRVVEGETVEVEVLLSKPAAQAVRVAISEGEGSSTLTFEPGQQRQVFSLSPKENTVYEGDRTWRWRLAAPEGATLGEVAETVITLVDNDPPRQPTFEGLSACYTRSSVDDSLTIYLTLTVTSLDVAPQSVGVRYTSSSGEQGSSGEVAMALVSQDGGNYVYTASVTMPFDGLLSVQPMIIAADGSLAEAPTYDLPTGQMSRCAATG